MQSPNRRYLPAIDHLRALAALLIFYYHAYQLTYWDQVYHRLPTATEWIHSTQFFMATLIEGHTAVSLFLVISGFILTYGSLDSELNVKKFFANRALRILPLLGAVMLIGTWMLNYTDLILFLQRLTPLGGGLDLGPWTGVAWSLAIEAQLYLMFPFIHAALRRGSVSVPLKILALTYLLRLGGLAAGVTLVNLTYWTTLGHIEQFLAGAVAAAVVRRYPPGRWLGWLAPVWVLGIFAVLHEYHLLGGFHVDAWWRIFFPTVEAIMWTGLVVTWLEASRALPAFVSSVIKYVGEISYSIYLLHYPIVFILVNRHWYFKPEDLTKGILLSATFIYLPAVLFASWLTYTLIEKPFLDLRRRYVSASLVPPSLRATVEES